MKAEQIAARWEFARPGFALVGYEEIALPVYRLKLRLLVLQRHKLESIQEFIMKSIRIGVSSSDELSSFLGLPEPVIKRAFSDLVLAEDVHITAKDAGREHTWALTPKGMITLNLLETTVPEEASFDVDYDGLLRKISAANKYLDSPKDIRTEGFIEVQATPNRAPELDELIFAEVAQALRSTHSGRTKQQDLLSIVSIERRNRLYRPAVSLIYRGLSAETVQVAIALDGNLSAEYETAFAKNGLPSKLGMDVEPTALPLAPAWVKGRTSPEQSESLRKAVSDAQTRVLGLQEQLNRAETLVARQQAQKELERAEALAAEAAQKQTEAKIRFIKVFEHPELLQKALREASRRLLIISPWLNPAVVNRDFLAALEGLLRRSVDVYIGYGIEQQNERRNLDSDEIARQSLERLAQKYNNFHFKRFGDTHAKVLAWDSACVVLTSFNWLSFKGDRNRGYRDEQGTVVTIDSKVDEKFAEELPRFTKTESLSAKNVPK